MNPTYSVPSGVKRTIVKGHPGLTTNQGGKIIIDSWIDHVWREAEGRNLEELIALFRSANDEPTLVRTTLACLVEAGLLKRDQSINEKLSPANTEGELVSVIIVSHNSRQWLEECLDSILAQSYTPVEIIVVDNASQDGSADWLRDQDFPQVDVLILEEKQSLASALNHGIKGANGDYLLLLNPDVKLSESAISSMVEVANQSVNCAAVAAKLKLMWAPAFLNGLGNHVGGFGWGTDNAIGHLDLGQFDHWEKLASACFAATLIPKQAWRTVGSLDDNFPMYYEDSEWCYRARLYGYSIHAAPRAVVLHAFGGGVGDPGEMSPQKTYQVVCGRLRFIDKILGSSARRRFMRHYVFEDCLRILLTLLRGRWSVIKAYRMAWIEFLKSRSNTKLQWKSLQSNRKISDDQLLDLQRNIPMPLIRFGYPQLTRDIIQNEYIPAIFSGKTHSFPEIEHDGDRESKSPNLWTRTNSILRFEGIECLIYKLGKMIMWRLARP